MPVPTKQNIGGNCIPFYLLKSNRSHVWSAPNCHTKTESSYCGNCGTALGQTNSSDDQHGAIFKAIGSNGEIEFYDDSLILKIRCKQQIPFTAIQKLNYEPKLKFIMFTIINDKGIKEKLKINFAKGQIDIFDKLTDLCKKKGIEIAKDKIINRNTGISLVILVFVLILAGTSSDDNREPRNTPSTSDIHAENSVSEQTNKVEEESDKLARDKEFFLIFKAKILAIDGEVTKIRENFIKKSAEQNINKIYEEAKKAKELTEKYQLEVFNISVQDNISDDLKESLNKVKLYLNTAYSRQVKGFDYVMAFCESNKPSDLQSFKEELEKAQNWTTQAATILLVDTKSKLGITD